MVRKALTAALLVAALAVPAAHAAPKPKPLPPDQALALIAGPATSGVDGAVPVSKQEALAAMAQPAAATHVTSGSTLATAVAAATSCSSARSWVHWGTWPYDRELYEYTYWCFAAGDWITSYSTTISTDQALCTLQDKSQFLYAGGIGAPWVTVQVQAVWSCPIIGFIPYSVGGWLRTAYNDWGNASIVDHS
jgi:hypothetical protein